MLLIERENFKKLPKEIREYIIASCKLTDKLYESLENGLVNDELHLEQSLKVLNDKYENLFEYIKKDKID